MIGSSIAHFRITAKLGQGGMGEVYRAKDDRLNREVAVKLLPESFATDPERLARFQREAQVLASLNHANIGQVYGLEQKDGRQALILELIEGEDLDAIIERGALPVERALQIAQQIADALEAAHEKGIVHRDLKPSNVKITPDGDVKVLDFGLAKPSATAETTSATELEQSPTITFAGTQAGIILGTASYMSPEQASGQPVDARADVWSFGVVLFEMLTGKRLFTGETVSHVLASVLKEDVDLSTLPRDTPVAIARLLRRCLAKKPRERLHAIGDARLVIEDVLAGVDDELAAPQAAPKSKGCTSAIWAVLVALAAALAGALINDLVSPSPEPEPSMHLALQLAPNQNLSPASDNAVLAFSPDGDSLYFSGEENSSDFLFRANLLDGSVEKIPGTEDGQSVFLSPDGQWIGFAARGELKKVAVNGGNPFPLGSARGAGGATWLKDNTVVFAPVYTDGLFRVSADGGESEQLTTPDREDGELGHWWPDPLPGERYILFTAFRTPVDTSRIGVLDLTTGQTRTLVEGGFFARYVKTGHLLYAKGQRVYAVPIDASTATLSGSPVAVLDDVRTAQTGGYAEFAVSSRGMLAYVTESLGNPPRELVWLDRSGRTTPAIAERNDYLTVTLSPDNRQIALSIKGTDRDLWTYSLGRGTLSRLTTGEDTEFDPIWSTDGKELYYVVDRPPFDLYRIGVQSPDTGQPIWNTTPEQDWTAPALHPDGRTLAFTVSTLDTRDDLYARAIDSNDPAFPVRTTRNAESNISFSPDGRWIVYASDETGRFELYVEAFPGPGDRAQITADGGSEPIWARNGEIFYRNGAEFRVIGTRLRQFEFDAPVTLFSYPVVDAAGDGSRTYDVTADGQRIIGIATPEETQPRRIEVVTRWTDALAR